MTMSSKAGPTPRELAVARLVAEGVPNKLIAVRLGISHMTVRHHLNNLYKRVGASDSAHMVAILFRQGLLQ
jgi:two-component system, NarL family, nitrate/nitrite response regulator NarL